LIEIHQDTDTESPNDWGNRDLFLVGFHRDFWVQRKGFDEELVRDLLTKDGITEEYKETLKKYHVFGLEAYIHSGVSLHLIGEAKIDRQWDVSAVGAVFVDKKEWRTRKSAEKAARGLIETWNQYLSGEVYGYIVKNADGSDIEAKDERGNSLMDSCWGFYGTEHAIADAKDSAEYIAKRLREIKTKKIKAFIKNKVPLAKRDLTT
jgi:hypothetical protein